MKNNKNIEPPVSLSATGLREVKISIIIPARDEAASIGRLISQINDSLSSLDHEVILVDDGSKDNTRTIAEGAGAKVISHPASRGKGAAMKTGAEKATGDIIVFMDGDGQHNPDDIPGVIAPILDNKAEMVIGSRTLPESRVTIVPFTRKWSNSLASFITSVLISIILPIRTLFKTPLKWTSITDCTSGFRAIKKEEWHRLNLISNGFEIETEMIMESAKNRLRIKESPISCSWDGKVSRLYIVKDGIKTLKLLLKKVIQKNNGNPA